MSRNAFSSAASAGASPRRTRTVVLGLLVLAMALVYPAARLLPVTAGWENSLLENLQLALLVGGGVWAWGFARGGSVAGDAASIALGRASALVWLVLAARELSWGAVLGEPGRMESWGPVYSSSTLWYKPAVYPVAALMLCVCLYLVLRHRVLSRLWGLVRRTSFVWLELGLALLAMLLGTYAEGHLPGIAPPAGLGEKALVMEEWVETVAYAAILAAQGRLFFLLRCTPT